MGTIKRFQRLVKRLGRKGFRIPHQEESQVVVEAPESESSFILFHSEEWIQVAAILVDNEAIRNSASEEALGLTVLRVHRRYLGCRLGFDADSSLAIQCDIYPKNQSVSHIQTVIGQLDYVGKSVLPLLEQVLVSGTVPSDEEIDRVLAQFAD